MAALLALGVAALLALGVAALLALGVAALLGYALASAMAASRRSRTELEKALLAEPSALAPDATGPIELVAREPLDGGERCEIAVRRLVAVDPADPGLRDVCIAVPVSGSVELRDDGELGRVALGELDAAALREARSFAKGLIEGGLVRGLGPERAGPRRARATHEVQTDAQGRRVIRRVGYASG